MIELMGGQMKKCYICGREAYFYSTYLKYYLCKKHLERMLIKRTRGAVISKGHKRRAFKLVNDGSDAYKLNTFLFKADKKSNAVLRNYTLEDFALVVLEYFLSKNKPKLRIGSNTFFNPLYTTSEDEISAFLISKGEKANPKPRTGREKYLLDLMKDVEKRRPGAMLSAVRIGEKIGII